MPPDTDLNLEMRARNVLQWLKLDASALMVDWPRKPGTLPFSGSYWVERPGSDFILITERTSEALDELLQTGSTSREFAPFIWKIDGGGVRFDFERTAVKVECHPMGKQPSSFVTTVRHGNGVENVEHVIERYLELETQWFLVWYYVRDV